MKSFASILAFASLGTATAAFTGASVTVLSKNVGESPDAIVAGVGVGTALVAGEKVVITYVLRHGEGVARGAAARSLSRASSARLCPPPSSSSPIPRSPTHSLFLSLKSLPHHGDTASYPEGPTRRCLPLLVRPLARSATTLRRQRRRPRDPLMLRRRS